MKLMTNEGAPALQEDCSCLFLTACLQAQSKQILLSCDITQKENKCWSPTQFLETCAGNSNKVLNFKNSILPMSVVVT